MSEGQQFDGFKEISPWHGHPRYTCDQEDFTTTRLDLMEGHVKQHKPRKRLSDVLGPTGDRIEVAEDDAAPAGPVPAVGGESGNTDATAPGNGDDHEESESG